VIVAGGVDFIGAPVGSNIGVTVLGNAPITDPSGVFLQVSPSDWDTVLDLAQCRAAWKQGGSSFREALALEARAIQNCATINTRLRSQGHFSDILDQRGQVQERDANRYNTANKK
jgi:hypothetical protein